MRRLTDGTLSGCDLFRRCYFWSTL